MSTTVLAVDDSKTMRKVLEITFASEDFKTLLAANADEAMQHLRSSAPSVALVDAGLGAVSGYDLCQQIKAQAPGTAVLVLSSKQQPYDKGRGNAVGADDFMDKPFDTQQLIDKVKGLLKNAATGAVARAPVAAVASSPMPEAQVRPQPVMEPARVQTLSYGSTSQSPPQKPAARAVPPRSNATSPGLSPNPPQAMVSAPAMLAVTQAVTDTKLQGKLSDLGLSTEQVEAVLALSREVVERVVWEVVPTLAETLIKEEIQRLTSS